MTTTRYLRPAALAAALLTAAVAAAPALAHEGNPKYRSEVTAVSPTVVGLDVRVLDHDDALELTNRSGRTVVAYGYEHEPYIRIRADKAVQVNDHSATAKANSEEEEHEGGDHADEDHSASGADDGAAAAVHWVTLDRTGRFSWHDDRIKWRTTSVPPQVTDASKETKVLDWQVPIRVGTQAGAIEGTLFWVGEPGSDGGFPVAAGASLAALALLAVGAVVLVRRRRSAG